MSSTPTKILAEVGYTISQLRKKQKMSQAQLAKKLQTTQSVIARIEAGNQNLTIDTLSKIAQALNRTIQIRFVK